MLPRSNPAPGLLTPNPRSTQYTSAPTQAARSRPAVRDRHRAWAWGAGLTVAAILLAALLAPSTEPELPRVNVSDLNWPDYNGVLLPTSATDGPRDQSNGLAIGFSHTPRGALLAAVNIGVRAEPDWGPDIFEPTINDQVIGPDRTALLANCRAYYPQAAAQGLDSPVEEGFRWKAYTRHAATVDILIATPTNGAGSAMRYGSTPVRVVWKAGDWRVVAPPHGNWGSTAHLVTPTADYTFFPAH